MIAIARPRIPAAVVTGALLASLLLLGVRVSDVRAEPLPPPTFNFTSSPSSVVPGPGDPNAYESGGSIYGTDTPGELCGGAPYVDNEETVGIYHAPAGSTGPLVVDGTSAFFEYGCVEGVDQSLIDDMIANSANYYIQVTSYGFPDGAIRGQLEYQPPQILVNVSSFFCAPGTKFPPSEAAIAKNCGSITLPADVFAGQPGFTSTGLAGTFDFNVRVQGPDGFDQDLHDAFVDGGGGCNPDTLTCFYGSLPYDFQLAPGPTTVDPTLIPSGMKLAYTHATINNVDDVVATYGAGGHVAFDMTAHYSGWVSVQYYFTGSPAIAPPAEVAPGVDLAQAPIGSDGSIPLQVQVGASEMGNGPVSYSIDVSTDGHAFQNGATTTRPVAIFNEKAGHTYRFRVQATNGFGVKSAWVVGDPVQLDVIQNDSSAVQYTAYGGGWTTSKAKGAFGGTITWTNDYGDAAFIETVAREIGLVMPQQPNAGSASVNDFQSGSQPLDLSSSSYRPRQTVYVANFYSSDDHQLEVDAAGGRVEVDAFVILK